ncbi:putative NAD(P)-binding domain, NAD(P)-binding domain superfamily [Helianthus debilis subsp. tardiflorus]
MANYTPKNILITGAAGFIASHVANRLIRSYPDYKIVVLDKLDYCSNLKNLNPSRSSPNFKFVKGDIGSGIGFKEEDTPNFIGSFYSKTKAMVEELLKEYDNVCTLRVRMPISSDLNNPRNFITKIARYNKVVNIPNSMTILDELLPISIEMAKRNLRGIWNFTNPGVVSHNEILEMYKKYINPEFKWVNFTLEEQAKVIVAPRSNNELDASKLKKEFPELMSIKESLIKYVFEPNKKH